MKIENIGTIAIVALLSVALLCVPAAATVTTIWSGNVNLEPGYFPFNPTYDPTHSYNYSWMTDLGAFVAASDDGNNFTYSINDSWYPYYGSFYLESINNVAADDTNLTAWFFNINGNYAEWGLGNVNNTMSEGDTIEFFYAPYDTTTWEGDYDNRTHVVTIHVI